MKTEPYCGFYPDRLDELFPRLSRVEVLCIKKIFAKCFMSKCIEDVPISHIEVKGISRMSFYRAMERLEARKLISNNKINCHMSKITLNSNYLTPFEIQKLTKTDVRNGTGESNQKNDAPPEKSLDFSKLRVKKPEAIV